MTKNDFMLLAISLIMSILLSLAWRKQQILQSKNNKNTNNQTHEIKS
jgi:hypothetical protein